MPGQLHSPRKLTKDTQYRKAASGPTPNPTGQAA